MQSAHWKFPDAAAAAADDDDDDATFRICHKSNNSRLLA